MYFDFNFEHTECCAVGMITNEDWGSGPSINFAAERVREKLQRQLLGLGELHCTTIIATTSDGEQSRYKFLNAVYKKAGFTPMGKALRNPNSGNLCKKWYINLPPNFKP